LKVYLKILDLIIMPDGLLVFLFCDLVMQALYYFEHVSLVTIGRQKILLVFFGVNFEDCGILQREIMQ